MRKPTPPVREEPLDSMGVRLSKRASDMSVAEALQWLDAVELDGYRTSIRVAMLKARAALASSAAPGGSELRVMAFGTVLPAPGGSVKMCLHNVPMDEHCCNCHSEDCPASSEYVAPGVDAELEKKNEI